MKRGLAYLGVAVVVLGVVVVAGTYLLPREVHIERTAHMERPPCTVFAVVNGFGRFNEWSPWAESDANTVYAYRGPSEGAGAGMSWTSAVVGDGEQEVLAAEACSSVSLALRFGGSPESRVGWSLVPSEGGTDATWTLDSDVGNSPIGRIMGTQLDRMIGPDYEKGLKNLTALVEELPATDFAGLVVERVDVPPVQVVQLTATSAQDPMAVGAALGGGYARLQDVVSALGLTVSGTPRASYRSEGTQWVIQIMLPVVGTPIGASADPAVSLGSSSSGPALKVLHRGAYMGLSETWAKVDAWTAAHGVTPGADPRWEEYQSDPSIVAQEDLQTGLYLPLKPAP